jgi:NAD(P)-dependent dehydrogenase (short-subunit alcohol dehydrogenase family)
MPNFEVNYRDSIVAVTGAASGIGAGIAYAFLGAQASVIALDVNKHGLDELERLHDASETAPRLETIPVNVTDADQVNLAVMDVIARHGKIDVLVNAAGISTMRPVERLTEEDWDRVFEVNSKGVFLMTRAVIPSMIERRSGCIVNVASAAAKRGSPNLSHYAASKFAVVGFTQSVALETAALGVRVNAVCPGFIETPMQEREIAWEIELQGGTEEEIKARYLRAIPMRRLGTAVDVARVVLFLSSEAAGYITGESVNVGGGVVMD